MVEGGEGCGKSTQAKLLAKFLNRNKIPCLYAREPGSTPEAEQIRNVLLNAQNKLQPLTELFLFEAARHEFFVREVLKEIKKGKSIASDRSGYSSEAYQGYAGGVALDIVRTLNPLATKNTRPDLLFIIDINAKKGLGKEQNADRFAAKGNAYHRKVNRGYREIAKRESDISIVIPYVDGDIEGTHEKIKGITLERLF